MLGSLVRAVLHRHRGGVSLRGSGRRRHAQRHQEHGHEEEKPDHHRRFIAPHIHSIQSAIPIIIKFSVSEMKPSGTLLDPPTHAHLSSRPST